MKTLKLRGWVVSVIGLAFVHCTAGGNLDVTSDALISTCGGFVNDSKSGDQWSTNGDTAEEEEYCKAERLLWEYDDGTLTLKNTRVLLNCCGDHDISIVEEFYGSYVITETDAPENGTRCRCNCTYDFMVVAKDVPEEVISIKLVREVINYETSDVGTVLETELDLSAYSGSVVVSTEDVGPWCN